MGGERSTLNEEKPGAIHGGATSGCPDSVNGIGGRPNAAAKARKAESKTTSMTSLFDQRGISRRTLVKQMLGGSAALVLAGTLASTGKAMAGPEKLVTSSALNLRSQPSLSGSVLLVIPAGAQVGYQDEDQNGFTKVAYSGIIGWAKSEYLSPAGSGGSGGGGWQGNPNNAAYRGQAITASAVNMRNGGGMNYGVKLVIPGGTAVQVFDDYANYFWLVNYNGEYGWV